jgi:hypothetical protein
MRSRARWEPSTSCPGGWTAGSLVKAFDEVVGAVWGCQALGVATARERAVSFMYAELERVATRDDDDEDAGEALPERAGRLAGVRGALRAVGLLSAEEAEAWRLPLSGAAAERPTPSDRTRRAADELLRDLLEAVPVDQEGRGDEAMRFEGAVHALRTVGAASSEWYERRARRMVWPTASEIREPNRGGTQKELRAVLAEAVDGVRVLCGLRFDDGVSLLLRFENGVDRFQDDRWDLELVDDVGTTYMPAGGGGGGYELRIVYSTPAPADATWLELRRGGSGPIRIPL